MYVETVLGHRKLVVDNKINVSPYAEVWTQPLQVAGMEVPQLAVMARDDEDNPQFIASHSTGYRLVPNTIVDQVIGDLLTRAEAEAQHKATVWNGKKLIERYIIPDVVIGKEGDPVALGIEGLNSYDGSTQFGVRFFMHRLVCTNGLYLDTLLGSFMFRHIGATDEYDLDDALAELREGTQKFLALAPAVEIMMNAPIDLNTVIEWHNRLTASSPSWPTSKTGLVLQALGNGRTVWDLVNAFTWVTTHNVTPFAGPKLSNAVCQLAMDYIREKEVIDV